MSKNVIESFRVGCVMDQNVIVNFSGKIVIQNCIHFNFVKINANFELNILYNTILNIFYSSRLGCRFVTLVLFVFFLINWVKLICTNYNYSHVNSC